MVNNLITASKLYDYLQCPHKIWRDVYGPQEEKNIEPNPFVELLWEKGVNREKEVVKGLGDLIDLSSSNKQQQFENTLEAMKQGKTLIYHGYLKWQNLAGEPDLLQRNSDGTYLPIDIKSGRGLEGEDENNDESGKPKKHYAVQLALYVEILVALGYAKKRIGIIYDIDSKEVVYDLDSPMGVRSPQTWWEFYLANKEHVDLLINNKNYNDPALSGLCKLCPWYQSCKKWCVNNEDLSTQFSLGRSKRETLHKYLGISKISELENIDIPVILERKSKDKEFLPKIASASLEKFKKRAQVSNTIKKPVAYIPIIFPKVSYELYFDIEDDPTRGFVYLHGVYERNRDKERFLPFIANESTQEAEREAWGSFWKYIKSLPQDDYCLYYYSKHEPVTYKRMQKQYPDIVTPEDIEELFESTRSIDLYYDVILKNTDWPLYSYSLKEIAQYIGFNWRDKTPSGALSIQWFNEYLSDKDPKKLQRIIEYNEDDCKATMIIKDKLELLFGNISS